MTDRDPSDDSRLISRRALVETLGERLGDGFRGHTMQRMRTPDGRYRYAFVSPGVRDTFGLDPQMLEASDGVSHDWVHPEDRDRFIAGLERSAATLTAFDEEVRVRLPDGAFKWVRSMGQPRRLDDGTVIWDGVALDVTGRRDAFSSLAQALDEARRDEASQGRMAAIAADDLSGSISRVASVARALKARETVDAGDLETLFTAIDNLETAFAAAKGVLDAGWLTDTHPPGGSASSSTADTIPPGLTARQQDVLRLLRKGLSNRAIAETLDIKEGTVKLHVSAVLKRLGVRNRTEAALPQAAPTPHGA